LVICQKLFGCWLLATGFWQERYAMIRAFLLLAAGYWFLARVICDDKCIFVNGYWILDFGKSGMRRLVLFLPAASSQ